MKLYHILFEQKGSVSYAPPDFGLHLQDNSGYTWLGLIHIPSLKEFLQSGASKAQNEDVYGFCAAMIACADSNDKCLGAIQIPYVASSPNWKGAGISMFAFASDYFGSPITSDRSHSDSVGARETWAKIEASPQWKLVGDGLDNYAPTSPQKTYMDFQGTYPNRTAKILPGSKTPIEIDDCPLPTKQGELSNAEDMAEVLGTANAYRYSGPLSAQPLISNLQKAMPELETLAKTAGIDLSSFIIDSLEQLFLSRYKGSGTGR
jgi:hypothetical protein